MLSEGVDIKENHDELVKELDTAIQENRFYPIQKKNETIGFITIEEKIKAGSPRLFVNKCFILKRFRDRCNLLSLRQYFRNIYKGMDLFYWRSKRRSRMMYFN
jgi:hypothetical protein